MTVLPSVKPLLQRYYAWYHITISKWSKTKWFAKWHYKMYDVHMDMECCRNCEHGYDSCGCEDERQWNYEKDWVSKFRCD